MVSFLKTLLLTGLPFGFFMALIFSAFSGWSFGVPVGLAAGMVFGLTLAIFVQFQSVKFTRRRPLLETEKLIKEGPANHWLEGEAVGGWIYLTDARLFYVSHKVNIKNHELSIPLTEIAGAEKARSFGIIPNQLQVILKNGRIEKFVVSGAAGWVSQIENLI